MPTPNGSHNQPLWDLADDADFAADLSTLSNYVATVGNIKAGTTAQRNALTGLDLWNGLAFRDSSTGRTHYYTTSTNSWVLETWAAGVVNSTTSSGFYRGTHGLGKTPSGISIVDQNGGTLPGQRGFSVSELSATEYVFKMIRTDTGGLLASNAFQIYVAVFA